MTMMRGVFTVGFWTLVSRVMGFLRDVLIAGALGASPVAEAFFLAFSLPNLFRRFFAEGAFNIAFVPMFSKKLATGDAPLAFCARCVVDVGAGADRAECAGHVRHALFGLGHGKRLCGRRAL